MGGTEISAKPEYVEAIKMGSSQSSAPPARAAAPSPAASDGVLALQDDDKKDDAELVFATPPTVVLQKRVPAKVPTMEELIENGLELKRRRQAMEQRNAAKAAPTAGEG